MWKVGRVFLTCHDFWDSCSEDELNAILTKCDCSGNTCATGKFCYDGMCNDEAKPVGNAYIYNFRFAFQYLKKGPKRAWWHQTPKFIYDRMLW